MADTSDEGRSTNASTTPVLESLLVGSGFFFYLMGALCIGYAAYLVVAHGEDRRPAEGASDIVVLLAVNSDVIALALLAILAATIGHSLVNKASESTNYVIRPDDAPKIWPLISEEKKDAIALYMEIARLSGLSGKFVRFGFTGLPLATVVLTIIFVLLSFKNEQLLDLAKLTLGAFIGSFVQRGSDAKNGIAAAPFVTAPPPQAAIPAGVTPAKTAAAPVAMASAAPRAAASTASPVPDK